MTLIDFIFLQANSVAENQNSNFNFMEYVKLKLSVFGDHLVDLVPRIIGAILILIIGFWVINRVVKILLRKLDKSNLNEELKPFLRGTVNISLKAMVILVAAGVAGVETASFAALLAAVGFSLGLAFQGSLGHLASGVLIFIFKPFKVGDYVEIHEKLGRVTEIELLNTHIKTFDNKDVIIPNGMAISDVVTNLSNHENIRVEIQVPIGYWVNYPEVKSIIENTLQNTKHVKQTPSPFVGIHAFSEFNVTLDVFTYCQVENYWEVYYGMHQNIKKSLHEHNIKVTYHEGIEIGEMGE